MRGIRPLAFVFGVLVWLVFVWLLGLLAFFSPSSRCVSFLFIDFIDDLGTPPTRRPYSWKKNARFFNVSPCFTRAMHDFDDRSIHPFLHICTPSELLPLPAPGSLWAGVWSLPLRKVCGLPAAAFVCNVHHFCAHLATVAFTCAAVCNWCAVGWLFSKACTTLQLLIATDLECCKYFAPADLSTFGNG